MSRRLPERDFYHRFYYNRQNAEPYQRDNRRHHMPSHLTNSVPASPVAFAPVPLMPNSGLLFANETRLLQLPQPQPLPYQLQVYPNTHVWSGPFQTNSLPTPSNTNQNRSLFREPDVSAAGTSSSSATANASVSATRAVVTVSRSHDSAEKSSMGSSVGRQMNFTRDQMNTVADDCIERLSESKEYVSLERIEKLFLQHYSAQTLAQLNLRNLDELPCVGEHLRRECRVNLYIQMFIKTRAICTVYELSQCLREFTPNRQEFETLRLGPLVKMPLVYESFLQPADKEMCEIETAHVLEYLKCYLTENDLWVNNKGAVEDFLKYMKIKRGLSTPYELGVRLKSLPLGIQVLKKGQRDCSMAIRDAVTKLKTVIENDIDTAFRCFISGVFQKEPGICRVRQEYLSMPFVDVVNSFFGKLKKLYAVISEQEASWALSGRFFGIAKSRCKEISKVQATLNDLRIIMSKDVLLRKLMHIAICCSEEQIHNQIQSVLRRNDDSSDESGDESDPEDVPKKDELIAAVLKYMERCIVHGPLTLDKLSKIEEKVIEDFKLKHFNSFNQGNFLQFLLKSEPVHKLLDESGGTMIGSSRAVDTESCYHAKVEDLVDFISQCAFKEPLQHQFIEMAICHHYSVKDVKFLGHGQFANLVKMAEKQQHPSHSRCLLYASTLVAKQFPAALAPDRSTGPLGHVTKEQALACLQSCPLLEDLAFWSHWDLVFKPELKELKDFMQKYGGAQIITLSDEVQKKKTLFTNILALEVRPGVLLKLTSDTSPEMFAKAAADRDVSRTCGHLVSLIAVNCGVEHTPLALLGNNFRAALLQIHASQPNEIGTYNMKGQRDISEDIVQFVLDCIVRIPLIIGHHVINQVFLEGLGFVIGQTKSKELLLSCARSTEQQGHLQMLGILLGIREWADGFHERLRPPFDCVKDIDSDLADIVTVESSDEDVESSSESDFSLSDDSDDGNEDGNKNDNDIEEEESLGGNNTPQNKVVSQKPNDDAIKVEASSDQTESVISLDDAEICIESDDEPMADRDINPTLSDVKKDFEDRTLAESEMEQQCQDLIERIRQEEFGFNVELNEDGARLLTKQQERLGRSLERLSKDLYSKDTHFVLELIQNADDNEYSEDMINSQLDPVPSVQFIVHCDSIVVYNNEVGFKEKNIRAICDVGRTTKGKHKFGYIGQKGIGFKSVFRVTDRPEIHSNGYHIGFDTNSKPLGYILPHWLNKDQRLVALPENWTTCIALPLKLEMREKIQSLSLAARFRDIHPSLLLFLHRLRSIEVMNEVEGYVSKMRRNDIGEGVTEIEHQNGVDRWLVVRKTMDASQISLQAKSGIEVESTEIALAFPMMSKEMIAAKVLPDRQPVFAFLPLRSYGFRFVVQGDFDVPSSREEIDRDSLWNQWLRAEIHHVFVNALEVFKSHSEFTPVEAVSYFLRFVPSTDEILDFFQPVAANILNQLKAKPCLPSQGLQWKLPTQLLICSDPLVREIVSGSLLRRCLGLDYLNWEVEKCLNISLLKSLGIQSLTTYHLIEVGKSMLANLNTSEFDEGVIRISKWLLCISRSMDEFSGSDEILASLRALPMIPLMNGKVVSLESQTLFFPLSTLEKEAARINLLKTLEGDMLTIHPLLLGPPENVSSLQIIRLLQQLGVKKLTPYEVIQHHILPALKSPGAEDKSRDLLVVYLMYIKEYYNSPQCMLDLNEIKEAAILVTNCGPKRPHLVPVHFSEAYENQVNLQRFLPGYPWILVDSCYLKGSQFVRQILEWKEFFRCLGVLDFLAVRQREVILKPSELTTSSWAVYKELLPDLAEYHILDSECEEFESLVKHNKESKSLMNQMKYLFEQLDRNWDAYYKKHAVTQVTNSQGVPVKEVATSFGNLLVSLEWIPSTFEDTNKLARSCNLFVNLPEIQKLMACHVSYVIPLIAGASSFAQYLGIKHSISIEFVVSQLLKWSARHENERLKPTPFESNLKHLTSVYEYLADNLPCKQIQELFDHPVIFFPDTTSKDRGCFLGKHEVRWSDPSGLFEKYQDALSTQEGNHHGFRVTIGSLYYRLKNVFLDIAQVQFQPNICDYTELLMQISLTVPLQRALPDVLHIYSLIGKELKENDEHSLEMNFEKLKALMKQHKAIPGKSGCWIGLDDKTMLADDKQLEKLFANCEVNFVECGEKLGVGCARVSKGLEDINLDFVTKFLTSLGVEKLSNSVDIKSQTEMYRPCPALQQYVREVIPFIQRMVYCYPTIYDYLVNKKEIKCKLANMQFAQVAKLELIHSLKNLPNVAPVIFPQKCCLLNDQELYVHQDSVCSYNEINRELARYFSCTGIPCPDDVARLSSACFMKLKSFLSDVLPLIQSKSSALDELLDEHNLLTFPTSEEPWDIKEPVFIAVHLQQSCIWQNVQLQMTSEPMNREETVKSRDNSAGLKSWPPLAPSARIHFGRKTHCNPSPLMWPPPPAPAHYKDHANLPTNLRPSQLVREPGTWDKAQCSYNEDSLQKQQELKTEDVGENLEAPGFNAGEAHESSSNESPSGQIFAAEIISKKQEQRDDMPTDEAKTESVVKDLEQKKPEATAETGQLVHHASASAIADTELGNSDAKASEPMVIEFKFPSTEADAFVRTGHKRMRVSSGSSSNEYSVSHAKQLIASHFYGPPVWLAHTDEDIFVDLGSADQLLVPQSVNLSEDSDTTAIGMWGEELVKNFLEKCKLQNDSNVVEIIHVNQESETGSPYDFIVRYQTEDAVTDVYIEVKTTVSSSKACFQISLNQLIFASQKGPHYHLYRVFSAGNPNEVRLAKIENLQEKMINEKVKLMMVI